MSAHSEQDFADLEKKNQEQASKIANLESTEKENKTLQSKIKQMETDADGNKKSDEKIKTLEAAQQAQDEKIKSLESEKENKEASERQAIATRIAQADVTTEKIKEDEKENRVAELSKQSLSSLQAALPYAEGEAKKHMESENIKQASITQPRYEFPPENKQAAEESHAFLKSYRSTFY